MDIIKYMKEFFVLLFAFLSCVCLLFIAVTIFALPALSAHYLDTLGYNDFIIYFVFTLQYMIIYVVARSTKFIDDGIVKF